MRFAIFVFATVLGLFLLSPAWADDKSDAKRDASNKDKLIGEWALVKGADLPEGVRIEFTKDGKLTVFLDMNGKKSTIATGTYKLEGDKLYLTAKMGDKDDTEVNTIKTLSAEKLVLLEPKGKEIELKKVAAKTKEPEKK